MASKRPAGIEVDGPGEKKRRLSLTIGQKVELLKKLDSGVSVPRLCEIASRTVRRKTRSRRRRSGIRQ